MPHRKEEFVELTITSPGDIESLFIGFEKDGEKYTLASMEPPAKMRIESTNTR